MCRIRLRWLLIRLHWSSSEVKLRGPEQRLDILSMDSKLIANYRADETHRVGIDLNYRYVTIESA